MRFRTGSISSMLAKITADGKTVQGRKSGEIFGGKLRVFERNPLLATSTAT
jgi:hypothetical protein